MASRFQLPFSRAGRSASPVDTYVVLVVVAGLVVGGWLLRDVTATFGNAKGMFWALAACALPAELVRVPVSYRGGVNQYTMSRPFVLALLLGWGAPLALMVFVAASVVSDLYYRKPALRVAFNAGQYALAIWAADAIYAALGGQRSFTLEQMPAFIAAAVVLVMVNRLLVRVVVALYHQHAITISYLFSMPMVELVEAAVQAAAVLVALLVAEHNPILPVVLALPALPLFVAGQASERLQALMARRRGPAGDLADPEQQREAALRTVELQLAGLAAALHDGPIQHLQQLVPELHRIRASIEAGSPDAARLLHKVEEAITTEGQDLRLMVGELRPLLQRLGLPEALTRLAKDLQTNHDGIVIDVQARAVEGLSEGLSEELKVLIYRVANGALTNVVKHAHASHVTVTLTVDDSVVRLQIHDDGTGFDPRLIQEDQHYGLALMRKWVELAGGVFRVDSMHGGGGTTVTLEIKIKVGLS